MPDDGEESLEHKKELLLESVERSQEELRHAVDELTTVAHRRLDLRERIAEHPWPWLLGAFAVGLWLARD
jgi:hypothetical protein